MVTYRPLPIMYPQQFYSPKYKVRPAASSEPDYRSTLFWEPNVNTGVNGKAKINFFTSDVNAKYTVKITGIDVGGGIGDAALKLNSGVK